MEKELKLKKPIFLIGSERSGSNLVRVIHGNHPNIAAPGPPNLMMTFLPRMPYYGDLSLDSNFHHFCEDVANIIDHQVGEWKMSFKPEEMLKEIENRSFIGVFDFVYYKEMTANGSNRVFMKENECYYYCDFLLRHYPNAKFVYLIRDGRDFAVSYMKSPNHIGTLDSLSDRWSKEQQQCLLVYSSLKNQGNIHAIHYEDIVSYPEDTVRKLCAFLDEDFSPEMLEFYKKEDVQKESKRAKNWENLSKPINSKQVNRYKRELTSQDIIDFEQVTYKELILTGYRPDNTAEALKSSTKKASYFEKGFALLGKVVTGKTMSFKELNNRRALLQVNTDMVERLEKEIKPVLKCRMVDES